MIYNKKNNKQDNEQANKQDSNKKNIKHHDTSAEERDFWYNHVKPNLVELEPIVLTCEGTIFANIKLI